MVFQLLPIVLILRGKRKKNAEKLQSTSLTDVQLLSLSTLAGRERF